MSDLKEKILSKIQPPQLMSLATITQEGKPWVRYVMAFGGGDLSILFVTGLNSRKVSQIQNNPEVHMTCGSAGPESRSDYLQIAGTAAVSRDSKLRHRLWGDHFKAYFSGPDDPNYAVVVVEPYRIELMGMDSRQPEVWEKS